MNIEPEQSLYIKTAFQQMKTKEDFLALLNYTKELIFGINAHPLQLRQLNYYINSASSKTNYKIFTIKKKSGKDRTICAPTKGLKVIQTCLNLILQQFYEIDPSVNGFVTGSSVAKNANIHVGSTYVFNIDLKDFFTSIDQARIWGRLQLYPYNLSRKENRLHFSNMISALSCHEMDVERMGDENTFESIKMRVLPQGAPTSPILSNIICEKLDRRLKGVAKKFGVKYSRYADDITFSSSHNTYQQNGEFFKEVRRIIKDQNFYLNESKTRLQNEKFRQDVTGIIVNKKVNVDKRYVDKIRIWLHYWEKLGFAKAEPIILAHYITDKGYVKNTEPNIKKVIEGKLNYLSMVKGSNDPLYIRLKSKLDNLVTRETTKAVNHPTLPKPIIIQKEKVIHSTIVHDPQKLVSLLKNFSINDRPLKYTTHSWDAGRDAKMFQDIAEFIAFAKDQYKGFSYDLSQLSKNLNGKIFNFIFNPDIKAEGWGVNRIRFGWSSPELREETDKNRQLSPEDVMLPLTYQLKVAGQTIQKFKHVIDVFKNEIEIRDENSALQNLILEKHDKYLLSFSEPKVHNLDNKTFYTDVQWFSKALNLIFENIQIRPQHPEISYSVRDDQPGKLVLEILQIESFNIGKSKNDEKLGTTKGSFGDICSYLKNLCDWSIESKFSEGSYRINYLVSDPIRPPHEPIEKAEGFKHILTFYKSDEISDN